MKTHQTFWLVENAIIYQKSIGHVKLEDIIEAREKVESLINAADGKRTIHILNDATETLSLPQDLRQLKQIVLPGPNAQKIGWIVSVSGRRIDGIVMQFVSMISQVKMTHFNNLDDALAFLMRQDASLPLLEPALLDVSKLTEL